MLHRLWKSQKRFSSSGWLAKVLDFVYFWSSVVYNSVIACFIDRFLQRKFIWVSYYRVFQIVVRVTVLITLAPESFWILFYIPKVILKLYLDGKLQVTLAYYLYYKRDFSYCQILWLLKVKPFLLTLRTIISFGMTINIIWFFHQMVIGRPLNLTFCGYSKFMKMICAFDELPNFVHVKIRL